MAHFGYGAASFLVLALLGPVFSVVARDMKQFSSIALWRDLHNTTFNPMVVRGISRLVNHLLLAW